MKTSIYIKSSFDYITFIPKHRPKTPLRGYSSEVIVEISGPLSEKDIIIDFSELKRIVRETIKKLDKKIIVYKKYVKILDNNAIIEDPKNKYFLKIPLENVIILDFEGTSEMLSYYLVRDILKKLPSGFKVKIRISEGFNKGSICEL